MKTSGMNVTELRKLAVELGANKAELYGTSRDSMVIVVNRMLAEKAKVEDEKKTKYIEERRMDADKLRGLCIEHKWYDIGTNRDYSKMLNNANSIENVKTEDIVEIATDIIEHSSELTVEDNLESVAYSLMKIADSFLKKVESDR